MMMTESEVPKRRSVRERIAGLKVQPNPLVETDLSMLEGLDASTSTFSVAETGELVVGEIAPLPLTVERAQPLGELDPLTASAYHLLTVPQEVTGDDLEALAISVWNEAGWASPGVLRLLENVTLEGPWTVGKSTGQNLGLTLDNIWLLRCAPHRGAPPSAAVLEFDEWARAFPEGMPVGVELKVLEVLRRIARRLEGALRVAGSGALITPQESGTLSLRVYSDQWVPPAQLRANLDAHIAGVTSAGPDPLDPGAPYALLAPVSILSQVLVGVREERFPPRALRWERWAQANLIVYEVVWVQPPEMVSGDGPPSRRARLEMSRATTIAETVAAMIALSVHNAAVVDEGGFLLSLDEPQTGETPAP